MRTATQEDKEKAAKLLEEFYQNKADQKLCKVNSIANFVLGGATMAAGFIIGDNKIVGLSTLILAKGAWDDKFSKAASRNMHKANEKLSQLIQEVDVNIPDSLYDVQQYVSAQQAKNEFVGIGVRLTNAVFKNKKNEHSNRQVLDTIKQKFVRSPQVI